MKSARVEPPFIPDFMPCPRCQGDGCVALVTSLQRAMTLLRQGLSTARQIAHFEAIAPTATINRLETLRRLGLVEREKEGREYRYRVVEEE